MLMAMINYLSYTALPIAGTPVNRVNAGDDATCS